MGEHVCHHPAFTAVVEVVPLARDGRGRVRVFAADVTIGCAACGEPFVFLCPEVGAHPDRPAVSVAGTEIRLPIAPARDGGEAIGPHPPT